MSCSKVSQKGDSIPTMPNINVKAANPAVISDVDKVVLFSEDPPPDEDHWTVVESRNIIGLPSSIRADRKMSKIVRITRQKLKFKGPNGKVVEWECYVFGRVASGKFALLLRHREISNF